MDLSLIKSPKDILEYMISNIKYGWLDLMNKEHIGNMNGFRKNYRTSSLDEILNHKIGSCIEQTYLMKVLLDNINIPSRMFCIREYEDDNSITNFGVYVHCFILYSLNDKVYHIENCNLKELGIHEYSSYEEAINSISKFFIMVSEGRCSTITEFFDVPYGMTFREFNNYMNSLDKNKVKVRKREYEIK